MVKIVQYLCIFALLLASSSVNSSRILGIFHFPSQSHQILGKCLLKALAEKGHQVTMLSPFPENDVIPNYRNIELVDVNQLKEENMKKWTNASLTEQIYQSFTSMPAIIRAVVNNPAVKRLLNDPNEKFDLVIQFWPFGEPMLGIADHFNAPVIGFSPIGGNTFVNMHSGNPAPYSYVPHMLFSFTDRMTFFQRVANTLVNVVGDVLYKSVVWPFQERVYNEAYPNGTPLQKLVDDVNLFLVNSHYSTETPRPYLPNMVNIGGYCVENKQSLSKDLQEYLDSAKEGFIYVSFGSNVKASQLSDLQKEGMVKTLSNQKLKILWKFEEDLPNKSDNVMIGKWFPQKAVMAHPNLKLFISHGGMGSVAEAIYNGVPIVGIPFFGDQDSNIADAVQKGFAEKVALSQLSEETLSGAVDKILNDPSYRENIQIRSSIYRDQEMKPIDRAIFWVEHVIKHKGSKHLKAAASDLPFYQYYLLDVMAFLFGVVSLMTFGTYWVGKKVLSAVCRKFCNKKVTKKLKKK